MKLIKIKGNIWELTCLKDINSVKDGVKSGRTTQEKASHNAIKNKNCLSGWIGECLSKNMIKSTATAIIETSVNGLPTQIVYDIYHNSKGFFCKVQGRRIFLKEIIENE